MAEGSSLDRTEAKLQRMERTLQTLPEGAIQAMLTSVGVTFDEWNRARRGTHRGQIWVFMRAGQSVASGEVDEVLDGMRADLASVEEVRKISVSKVAGGPPIGKPVFARIRGPDLAMLQDLADRLKARLAEVPGVFDIHDSLEGGKAEYVIAVDETKAGLAGMHRARVAEQVFFAPEGGEATRIRRGTTEVKVRVKLQEELPQAQGLAVLEEILVPNNMRGTTPLKGLVAFQRHEGVPQIEHFNFRRSITVTADVDDRQITGFGANRILEKAFTELRQHYAGYDLSFGGEEE
jgi:multidrug efflux pump subunit AcrB